MRGLASRHSEVAGIETGRAPYWWTSVRKQRLKGEKVSSRSVARVGAKEKKSLEEIANYRSADGPNKGKG